MVKGVWSKLKHSWSALGVGMGLSPKTKGPDVTFCDDTFLSVVPTSSVLASDMPYDVPSKKGIMDKWIIGEYIAEGAFGLVQNVTGKRTKIQAVMKTSDKKTLMREYLAKKEALIMWNLPPNAYFPKMLDYVEDQKTVSIVMSTKKGQELGEYANEYPDGMPEDQAQKIIIQLMESVMICHAHGILHRDIKLDNVLWDSTNNQLSLIDFGVSSFMYNDMTPLYDMVGCMTYASPGLLKLVTEGIPYRASKGYSDLWAIGILTYGLLTGYFPFKDENPEETQREIESAQDGTLLASLDVFPLSNECKDFMVTLLNPENEGKITAQSMMKHPWLNVTSVEHNLGIYTRMDFAPILRNTPLKMTLAIKEIEKELSSEIRRMSKTKSGSSIESDTTAVCI